MADEGTFATTAEILRKAGANASATSSAEAYTNQYIKEVEGHIIALARYDFKTNYASVSAFAKEFLREAASNLAAIYVLNYDYNSANIPRLEVEDRINVMWARWKACERLLLDTKFLTFLGAN